MRTVDLAELRFEGIADTRLTPKGLRVSRLPAWAQAQIVDPGFTWAAGVPSGARLVFETDSSVAELDVQLLRLSYVERPLAAAAFDLVIDEELQDAVFSDTGHVAKADINDRTRMVLTRGGPDTIRFALPPGSKRVEIWLPHNASLEIRALRLDDGSSYSDAAPTSGRRWIHYGSSISHCTEAARPTNVWPVVAARKAGVNLTSFGIAGQAQLDQVVARTIRDLPADLISIKVGINIVNGDTMRERTFVPAAHGFLDTVRDGHPDEPLLIVTPIICPAAEDRPGPTLADGEGRFYVIDRPIELSTGALTLTRIRELLAMIVEQRNDANLHLMSGLDLFGPDDLRDLPDGLHPNDEGYVRMGERFYDAAFCNAGAFA